MSDYLVRRLLEAKNIELLMETEISKMLGDSHIADGALRHSLANLK